MLSMLFIAVLSSTFAQNRLFSRLSADNDVNYVYISKDMLSTEHAMDKAVELSALFDIMSGLESIEILTTQNADVQNKAMRKLPECVDGLVCFVDNGCDVDDGIIRIYKVPEPDGMASSFLMIKQTGLAPDCKVGPNSAMTAILLTGDIDADKLRSLTQ